LAQEIQGASNAAIILIASNKHLRKIFRSSWNFYSCGLGNLPKTFPLVDVISQNLSIRPAWECRQVFTDSVCFYCFASGHFCSKPYNKIHRMFSCCKENVHRSCVSRVKLCSHLEGSWR